MAGHLVALETLEQADSSESIYDQWSDDYDQNLMEHYQYIAPKIAVDAFCEFQQPSQSSIIDYGCGTGIVGELLAKRGYHHIDGMDISQGMLDQARPKMENGQSVYQKLIKADLTQTIETPDEHYEGMICVGSFANGHLQPWHLDEMLRTIRMDGPVVLFMNEQFYLKDNFPGYFEHLGKQRKWELIRQQRHNYMEALERPGWLVVARRC